MNRPEWADYFFGVAKMVSARSTCPSRQVGAVLVDPNTNGILATGYNGSARGTEHCGVECSTRKSGGDWEKCKAIHAELNCIISAAQNGVRTDGSTMYLTTTPCVFCARLIINAGVKVVIAASAYPHQEAIELLRSGSVKVMVVTGVPMPTIKLRKDDENV